jgi:hypothetical protein
MMRPVLAWLRPEARFLILAARRDTTNDRLAASIPPGFNWGALEALAMRELAVTYVYRRLRDLSKDQVPAEVLRRFAAASMVAEFRMQCLERGLRQATAALVDAGVRVLLLKGAGLGITVYPAFTERSMQDIDLLVTQDQEDLAWRVLRQSGWEPAYPEQTGPFYEGHQHRVPLVAPRLGGPRLELHTRLFHGGGPFANTAADLFRDAAVVSFEQRQVYVPSAPHGLLYLCQHLAWTHAMNHGVLHALQDVDALWRGTGGVDPRFVPLAREARAATCCYWTLRFARGLFDVPVPDAWLAALRPPRSRLSLALLERHFAGMSGLAPMACPSARIERAMWNYGFLPAWSGHGDHRPWTAGEEWAQVDPAGPAAEAPGGAWTRGRAAFTRLRRYAGVLLNP